MPVCALILKKKSYLYLLHYSWFSNLSGSHNNLYEFTGLLYSFFNCLVFNPFIHNITFYSVKWVILLSANIMHLDLETKCFRALMKHQEIWLTFVWILPGGGHRTRWPFHFPPSTFCLCKENPNLCSFKIQEGKKSE